MESLTPEIVLLPSDVKGRIACVVLGSFFLGTGGPVVAWLLSVPFKPQALAIYEFSILWFLFGGCTLLRGLFMPKWIRTFTQRVVGHFVIVVAVLFLPFAFQAIAALLSGKV